MGFGENVAKARKAKGLTQDALAEKLGVTFQAVSTWERGENFPDSEHLLALAEALDASVDGLLREEEPGWTRQNRLFDEERMYTFLKTGAAALGLNQTLRSMELAREKHAGQYRKCLDGEEIPYIIHPLTLACNAWAMNLRDDDVLSALLLHDVVEDTGTKPEDLPVNDRVREVVCLVSYNTYGPEDIKEQIKDEYYRNIAGNPLACLVKCVDRCNNLSCMSSGFSRGKLAEYVLSTEKYVLPLLDVIKKTPEYNNAAWLLRYQMTAILEAYKRLL